MLRHVEHPAVADVVVAVISTALTTWNLTHTHTHTHSTFCSEDLDTPSDILGNPTDTSADICKLPRIWTVFWWFTVTPYCFLRKSVVVFWSLAAWQSVILVQRVVTAVSTDRPYVTGKPVPTSLHLLPTRHGITSQKTWICGRRLFNPYRANVENMLSS